MTASVGIELTCFSGRSHPGPSASVEADIRYWVHETSLQLVDRRSALTKVTPNHFRNRECDPEWGV
jgi:hypothetical protein